MIANIEAEAALLGAMMAEPRMVDVAADRVGAEHFAEALHGRIFTTIVTLHGQGKVANPVTLKPFLESDEGLASVGGVSYLARLTGSGAEMIGAKDFAEQVKELAQRRSLVAGCQRAIDTATDYNVSLDDCLSVADAALDEARGDESGQWEQSAANALQASLEAVGKPERGIRCQRVPAVDNLLGLMRPGDMIVEAGRPGMGKSLLASAISLGVAGQGYGVLFVSLEMKAQQLAERMAADLCFDDKPVPYSLIRDGAIRGDDLRQVMKAKDRLDALPLVIADKSGLRISQLRTLAKRWSRRFKSRGTRLGLIVVDYLQLIRGDGKLSPYETVSEASRSLKELAKEHDCPVLALAQLSRQVEQRADKRPMLSDLRESGQIEQDADSVIFLLRQEYYLRQQSLDDPDVMDALARCEGKVELILAKRRNGPTGTAVANFHGNYQAVR